MPIECVALVVITEFIEKVLTSKSFILLLP